MLCDVELKKHFSQFLPGSSLPTDPDGAGSPVQPSSIDLSVGQIYVPGADAGELGGVDNPRTREHSLAPGETAVVTTRETLEIPPEFAAIGFPPTAISNNGILMTNPGHVDPGYKGKLSFTVINMGRVPFQLRAGDRIVTLVVFKLACVPDATYEERQSGPVAPTVPPERLARLAPDMLNVQERIQSRIKREEHRTRRIGIIVPLLLAVIVGLGTIFAPIISDHFSDVDDLEDRVEQLEGMSDTNELDKRLTLLEELRSQQEGPRTGQQTSPTTVGPDATAG